MGQPRYFAMAYMALTTEKRRIYGEVVLMSEEYPSKTQIMDLAYTHCDSVLSLVVTGHHEFKSEADFISYQS